MKSDTDVNHRQYEESLYLIEICFDATYGLYNGRIYEGWNCNSGNYLFTTDTK